MGVSMGRDKLRRKTMEHKALNLQEVAFGCLVVSKFMKFLGLIWNPLSWVMKLQVEE
ncbi:hypothetical protein HanIR_Chr07g0332241 [Helianthus annuus]|nr:hypothetical protein HanIR_Chr07g0332241 [Helianthus annuus]